VQATEFAASLNMAQGNKLKRDTGELRVGHRFRLSELGMARCPRLASKVGTVVNLIEYSKIVVVRFDGNKLKTSINRDYIEPV
jgi:hypothetical protein